MRKRRQTLPRSLPAANAVPIVQREYRVYARAASRRMADSGRCKVHECARKHNVQFCGICDEFPCEQLTSVIHWNPDIVEHLKALAREYQE